MFRCALCGRVAPARTKAVRLVLETRERVYLRRTEAMAVIRLDKRGKPKRIRIDDPGGRGMEIVREAIVCPRCAEHG